MNQVSINTAEYGVININGNFDINDFKINKINIEGFEATEHIKNYVKEKYKNIIIGEFLYIETSINHVSDGYL